MSDIESSFLTKNPVGATPAPTGGPLSSVQFAQPPQQQFGVSEFLKGAEELASYAAENFSRDPAIRDRRYAMRQDSENKAMAAKLQRRKELEGRVGTLLEIGKLNPAVFQNETFVNGVLTPVLNEIRKDDAELAQMTLANLQALASAPQKAEAMKRVTLVDPADPTGKVMTLLENDPRLPQLLSQGMVESSQLPSSADVTEVSWYDEASGQEVRGLLNKRTMKIEQIGGPKAPAAPLVQNIIGTEKKEAEVIGGVRGEQYKNYIERATVLNKRAQSIATIRDILQGVETGRLEETKLDIELLAQGVGIPLKLTENATAEQAARALANAIALEFRNPAGGEGMPGNLSNLDLIFLKSLVPGLEMTPQARELMTEIYTRNAERAAFIAQAAEDWYEQRGSMVGFAKWERQYNNENRLYEDLESLRRPDAKGGAVAPLKGPMPKQGTPNKRLKFDAQGNVIP